MPLKMHKQEIAFILEPLEKKLRNSLTQVIQQQVKEVFKDYEAKLNEKFEQMLEKLDTKQK